MSSQVLTDISEEGRIAREQGTRLLGLDQPLSALECFDRALALNPNDIGALTSRGLALFALQRPAEAIESYDRALRIKPELAGALTNRSNALRRLQRLDEALRDLDQALRIRPAFPEALNNRGTVLRDLGRLEEAVASFDEALALRPDFPMALSNRGNALLDLKQPRAALTSFERALQLIPQDGEALFGRASARLQLQEKLDEAIVDFDRAAERGIERPETLVGKAAALAMLRRHRAAAACLSELLTLAPHRDYARGSWLHSRLQVCDWEGLPAEVQELTELVRQGRRATHPQSLLSLTDSPELQLACSRVFVADKFPPQAAPMVSTVRQRDGGQERIRVAYLSADFRDHPVSYLLVGALERHDRGRFEVIGISLRRSEGRPFEGRVRAAFDRFIEVTDRSDLEVAQLLRELQVDIAVDLMGLTEGLRLGILAHRAAPVQVTYLGYAGTLGGAPYVDYLLADAVVIPPGQEWGYGEQVVRLPHCYLPNDDRRERGVTPSRTQAGLPDRGFVFCAFTSSYKINALVFASWMRLLREVPGSVLWLREMGADAQLSLCREAQRQGVAAERLIYAPHVASMAEHLGRHALADLYLDTFPYNAHSTACDALWAAVPVLTCAGRSFASRVAASALKAVGLPELITSNLREYEGKALELAHDPQKLQALRDRLMENRSREPLFDTARFTRHLETAYEEMHRRAVRGEAPRSFTVEPSAATGDR